MDQSSTSSGLSCRPTADGFARLLEASRYQGLWHASVEQMVGSVAATLWPRPASKREAMYADVQAFNAVVSDLYKLSKGGESAGIVFSLDFEVFCDPDLNRQYMIALRQPPLKLLLFLTPRLVRVPPSAPPALVVSKVCQLKALYRRVVIETRPDFSFGALKGIERATVSLPFDHLELAGGERFGATVGRAFHKAAGDASLSSMVSGIDSTRALDIALESGFDFISGEATGGFGRPLRTQYGLSRAALAGPVTGRG